MDSNSWVCSREAWTSGSKRDKGQRLNQMCGQMKRPTTEANLRMPAEASDKGMRKGSRQSDPGLWRYSESLGVSAFYFCAL